MDYEVVYNIVAVVIFLLIAYKLSKSSIGKEAQSREAKQIEIVDGYKKQLKEELELLKDDNEKRKIKKAQLLKKISDELSRNIFFDADDIREIISELSHM